MHPATAHARGGINPRLVLGLVIAGALVVAAIAARRPPARAETTAGAAMGAARSPSDCVTTIAPLAEAQVRRPPPPGIAAADVRDWTPIRTTSGRIEYQPWVSVEEGRVSLDPYDEARTACPQPRDADLWGGEAIDAAQRPSDALAPQAHGAAQGPPGAQGPAGKVRRLPRCPQPASR
jgi:hypothetical protein